MLGGYATDASSSGGWRGSFWSDLSVFHITIGCLRYKPCRIYNEFHNLVVYLEEGGEVEVGYENYRLGEDGILPTLPYAMTLRISWPCVVGGADSLIHMER